MGQLLGAAIALVSAIIGSAMTTLFNLAQERNKRRARAESLSRAIAGEVSAVLGILAQRRIIEELQKETSKTSNEKIDVFRWRVSREYFPVTRSCIGDFGILPAGLTHMVPQLLTTFNAVLEDFDELYQGKMDNAEQDQLRALYHDLALLLDKARSVSEKIIETVNHRYPPVQ